MFLDLLLKVDIKLFHFINETMSNSFFDTVMPILTDQDNWVFPLVCVWLWMLILGKKKGRIAAVILLMTFIFTDAFSAQIIKPFIGRIRPSHTMVDTINLLVSKGGKYSFPSNHAANTMVLAVICGYFWPSWKSGLIGLSLMVGLSRVYVGVHYPFDVIAGWILGYGASWIILSIWVVVKMRELKRGRLWVWYQENPPQNS